MINFFYISAITYTHGSQRSKQNRRLTTTKKGRLSSVFSFPLKRKWQIKVGEPVLIPTTTVNSLYENGKKKRRNKQKQWNEEYKKYTCNLLWSKKPYFLIGLKKKGKRVFEKRTQLTFEAESVNRTLNRIKKNYPEK